jgi:presenilin-like A22 family membrane protease
MIDWLLMFCAMVVVDFIYAHYTKAASAHRALSAANWAASMPYVNGLVVLLYVNDPWLLIPCSAGAWMGTWLSMRWDNYWNDLS